MVEVEWIDSGGMGGWHQPGDSTKGFDEWDCVVVGYLLEDSDRGVCIVMGTGAAGMNMDSVTIPRANVKAVHRLRRGA